MYTYDVQLQTFIMEAFDVVLSQSWSPSVCKRLMIIIAGIFRGYGAG